MSPLQIKEMLGLIKLSDDSYLVYNEEGYHRAIHLYHVHKSRVWNCTHAETIGLIEPSMRTLQTYPGLVKISGFGNYCIVDKTTIEELEQKKQEIVSEIDSLIAQLRM